jgi:hypothetical protein
MCFEIASCGKQMVSKEGLKHWHQFGSQFVFLEEACFRTATEMAPISSKNGAMWLAGPFLVPHFVNNLA